MPEKTTSIRDALGDDELSAKALAAKVGMPALSAAWDGREIEFGRRTYVVTGRPGEKGSRLIVEGGTDWSGPKTRCHKKATPLLAEELPECEFYARADVPREARKDPVTSVVTMEMPLVSRAEATKLLEVLVRTSEVPAGV